MSTEIYSQSLSLLTDLYQLTMAYGYWKMGMQNKEAVFHLFFRKKPFGGAFAIAAGLETAINFLENLRFTPDDLVYLGNLTDRFGKKLFEEKFLQFLGEMRFTCDLDALEEGTPVFPYEPILRVKGPLLQAQLLESPLLNIINFQTLIATKASRIVWAAGSDPVVEFGMRRAQGIDGAISASRAAFIGGCESTSHLLAGKLFGIPVKGTQAHSWIMAFSEEEDSFQAFSEIFPDSSVFLIDTYDSLKGIEKAIRVAKKMRSSHHELIGVRLDSGDLVVLSQKIRKKLDEAGFTNLSIMASNELDEFLIENCKRSGGKINVWGVGTHLMTGGGQPALDGVYKLAALRDPGKPWEYKLKVSDQVTKTTDPGILQVRRFVSENGYIADMVYNVENPPTGENAMIEFGVGGKKKEIEKGQPYIDLLQKIFSQGSLVYKKPSLQALQKRTLQELSKFPKGIRKLADPDPYFCGLEEGLYKKKIQLIKESTKA
ncbi:MAG: nicotinate phosphoribosyltransferase [Chlamydiae bacterium]|nr:nicotinate phosphoribosyltransferase [Chlamydiota bacterium]